jgi:hypothetical protein
MSISSVSNTLTPTQILQLLQPSIGSADSNGTAPATEQDNASTGQTLPTGTESSADASTTTGASQPALDPKTVLALLKIQEGQMMQSDDPLLFGGMDSFGSVSTGDPLLDAMNGTSASNQTDPLQALIDQMTATPNAASRTNPVDPTQALNAATAMASSAAGTSSLATTNQSLLDLLNQTSPSSAASSGVNSASAAEQ